ncbi:hypothetical protein BJX66DRAFT_337460 [Aspergillus keveii]|uniref:Receptor-activated Ca2+-permeable cation channel n=1 Tax=Aspergillus keveii TaxID=714993 RepID=A0ABR4G8B2_9EURO
MAATDDELLLESASLIETSDEGSYVAHDSLAGLPVYTTIHRIRLVVREMIDDPYTIEQLQDIRMNALIVRPLVGKLYDPKDLSIVYCLLVNRTQFLHERSFQSHLQTVSDARANLCELAACRILRRFDDESRGSDAGLLLLANILVAGLDPFQNAPSSQKRLPFGRKLTALEVAILSDSKIFLLSSSCQKVIDAVYQGQITYTPLSSMDILPDRYKTRPIALYNPRKAPLLNHYRLIVPRLRGMIEACQFIILLVLYILTMVRRKGSEVTVEEMIFWTYASGWILEEFAAIVEHGWQVHMQNLWSFLDLIFITIFLAYFAVRSCALAVPRIDQATSTSAFAILSLAAPILLPRLAFTLMPDNMLFIALRAMMRDFTVLTLLAVWCFAGFFISMKWLLHLHLDPQDAADPPSSATISKWMLWIWFGLDGTGIERSVDFHTTLGPALMIAFAFLGNTLFLTILVAKLTNTFSQIAGNADAEIQFRRAVLTFEGVKSDAIFGYPPPFNILALLFLLPLKLVLSSRQFHSVNVAATRIVNMPLLLIISLYERQRPLWSGAEPRRPSRWRALWSWTYTGLFPHGEIYAMFGEDSSVCSAHEGGVEGF